MNPFDEAREQMVERQIAARGVRDPHVLDAMRTVPRHRFVPAELVEFAYSDTPLPLADDQTISQPIVVARMLEAATLSPTDRVLDVGTGSGYAAAVASRIVAHVDSIERHASLAASAQRTLAENGFANVDVHHADGTLGWPAHAPFDAIVAAAGGPDVPRAWREQLAIGGRIVMPIGDERDAQRLVRITRTGATQFEHEDLGAVRFVPLIGEQGWPEQDPVRDDDTAQAAHDVQHDAQARYVAAPPTPLARTIARAARPLSEPEDPTFADAFDHLADKRVVLLGECSHGTTEFYRARAAITRRLVERHGFNIVAVEADWPDAAIVHRYVMLDERRDADPPFQRFPTWMWRNEEFAAFVEWLRAHNGRTRRDARCGFHGLDMYSLSASVEAVLDYLDRSDPNAARIARAGDDDLHFDATQNARLVASAERYYRTMYRSAAQSWNLRDTHMFETLENLLAAKGDGGRAVVWAHNSHIGNAAATEMGDIRDELNVGQLCRERFGDDAALIGFGTHAGTVAAATDWGGPLEVMRVLPSRDDSYEHAFHESGLPRCFADLSADGDRALVESLREPRLERFIGVIYRPDSERHSHYAEARLSGQFDGYVWFDNTQAITPLSTRATERSVDLYPFGV
ncbi:TPA: protein-L-isoaspartate(D-aspartate) O-methyltransferase [Burkholderia multivorans]|nr:protein-L-isoaspartate(D-aspartate) O-methyltransferase [Burkholderia multivorans]HDR9295847.1 protein-L-isoaspartate(D-aspartate) O-methyltransferase [Burkholderia multivorans]HDR9300561.1 protein-L-isoaspartate(D-aspartate) O-methyltransferase [Burkholderia multivorans]HDR9307363.1 protein-L-isoaspartate(D-aspartate) O-methyltransferase [Burkholderia multivorans]HDR9311520.1 protein-L-isoaspartate(D-aspartate) O-methyltransferase [Burkholderia multivorans]